MLEPIKEDGYIYVPYYKDKAIICSDEPSITAKFEADYEGHGYSYLYQDGDIRIPVSFYYLEKEEAAEAKKNLQNYCFGLGKIKQEYTWDDVKEKGWEKKNNPTFHEETVSYHHAEADRSKYWFLYQNKVIVYMHIFDGCDLSYDDFIKDLKIKKVALL